MDAKALGLLVALSLGGVVAWREWDKRHETHAANTAAGVQLSGGTAAAPLPAGGLLTGTLPAGTTPPVTVGGNYAAQLAEQQRLQAEQNAALQRQQAITTLRRDLARIWNDIDVQVVQANSIKNQPIDPAFVRGVSDRVWAKCRAAGSYISQAYRCNDGNMSVEVAKVSKEEWEARISLQLQPVQAQLSRLNAEQQATVDNLRALGFTVPAVEIKKVTI